METVDKVQKNGENDHDSEGDNKKAGEDEVADFVMVLSK